MAGVIENITTGISQAYQGLIDTLPFFFQNFINLFLIVVVIFIYAWFIWKFYRFVSKKNIIGLNLNQYNKSEYPFFTKLLAGALYFAEYMIILPFLIFFWFAIFTVFLIFLTEDLEIQALLVISATIIAAIRMTAYFNEDLSKDVAKLLPFTLLAVSILNPNFFNFERILNQFNALPGLFGQISSYLIFIIVLEIVLRFFDFIFSLFGIEENVEEEENNKNSNK